MVCALRSILPYEKRLPKKEGVFLFQKIGHCLLYLAVLHVDARHSARNTADTFIVERLRGIR